MNTAMSAIGPKLTFLFATHMSAFGRKADMPLCTAYLTQSGHEAPVDLTASDRQHWSISLRSCPPHHALLIEGNCDAKDTPLQSVRDRCAHHPRADGDLYLCRVSTCRLKRRWFRWHRVSFSDHGSGQMRH